MQETAPNRFVFRHVLDSQAVEEAIPVSERRRPHHRAAQALQATEHPPVVRLSRHFREADDIEAWDYYAEASADLAVESGDSHTAVAVLLDLLTTAEHGADRRARLARKLGETMVKRAAPLGELEAAVREILEGVLARADLPGVERGEIRVLVGHLLFQLGEFEVGRAQLETAVTELADRPGRAARAMLMLAAPSHTRPSSLHLAWLERATALLLHVESPAERLLFALDRTNILLWLGEEAGWQAAAEIPDSAPTMAERQQIARSLFNVSQTGITWGRYEEARRWLAGATDLAQATGFQRLAVF